MLPAVELSAESASLFFFVGDATQVFVQDLGLALAAKMCPRRPQAFKKVNNVSRFRRKKLFFFF